MQSRHVRRGGFAAFLTGVLLLLGAPIAALAEEPSAPVAGETPPPVEVEEPPAAEEPPAEAPPVEEPPVAEPPVEEPPIAEPLPPPAPGDEESAGSTGSDAAAGSEDVRTRTSEPAPATPEPLGTVHAATLKSSHVGAMNPGFQTGSCPDNPFNDNTWGWHFVLPGNSTTFVTVSATFQNAGTITQFVSFPTGKHAYVWTPGPDTLLGATATVDGPETVFNLSHVCTGTTPPDEGSLSVIKAIQGTPGGPFTINVTCTLDNVTVTDVDLVFNGAGQQQVNNIPAGATCDVTETDGGGATSVSYSEDPPQNITIVADQVAGPVTVTNTFGEEPEVGSLEVTKEIEGTPPEGAQFLVHVTCTLNQTVVVDQDLPLFTSDGESQSISGIPAGAECVVEETGNFGAAVSYSPNPPNVTIVNNSQSEVTVTNTYVTGGLRVIKVVDGTGAPSSGTQFEVRVRCEFANQEIVDETLVFGSTGGEDSIDGIPAGATCDIAEPVNGGASNVTISPGSITIVGETTADATVTNTFTEVSPNTVVPTTGGSTSVSGSPSGGASGGASGSAGGTLPFTGTDSVPLAIIGALLLFGGAATVLISRRHAASTS